MGLNDRARSSVAADQPTMMRRRNFSAVLRTVLANGPLARSEIAERTGLSPAGVTKLASVLISAGLLRESDAAVTAPTLGRPRVPVEIDDGSHLVASIHIGTQWTTVGLVNLAGRLVHQTLFERGGTRAADVVRDAVRDVRRVVGAHAARSTVVGLGVAVGGWVDSAAGIVVEHAALGWENVPLGEMLGKAFAYPVRLDSTVRAMALAEGWFGTAAGAHDWVQVFIGNVVGAAIAIDHAIARGPKSAAGDLTHLPVRVAEADGSSTTCTCGHRNCLQVVASDLAVIAAARKNRAVPRAKLLQDVIDSARNGNDRARRLLESRARYVGQAVATIFELINPEVAVLAGGIIHAPEYLGALRDAVERNIHRSIDSERRILPSVLAEDAYPIAPAALVLAEYYRDPMAFEPLRSFAE